MAKADRPQGKTLRTDTPQAARAAAAYDAARSSRAEQSHPASQEPESGTLPTARDTGVLPVHEPGESVDPEELGVQFLRDATEQDNFESSLRRGNVEPGQAPLGTAISEGTLRAAGQEDVELPDSDALSGVPDVEATLEPATDEVDLLSNSIKGGSLFDQPTADGGTVAPNVSADERELLDEHRSKRGRAQPGSGPEVDDDESEEDIDGAHEPDEAVRVERCERR